MHSTSTKRPRRATIEDVASGAGVSVATVSRALRGLPNVAISTRERVNAVAASMHYRPDPAASRLAAGRTQTITVAVPSLNGWYFSTVVAGAEAVCTAAGSDFLVVGIGSLAERDRLLDDQHHLERRTDGLLFVELPISEEEANTLRAKGLSIATIGPTTASVPSLRVDDDAVGRLAAAHLTGLGHRRIGLIGGQPHDPMSFDVPKLRHQGFAAGLAAAGVRLDPELVRAGNFGLEGGQEAMAYLLDRPDPPTAVWAMSDEMAFGAMMELRLRELRPGADVAIMGVDDHEFARVVDLTTIRQTVSDHGATAARILIDAMLDPDREVEHLEARIELVERATTAPPAP